MFYSAMHPLHWYRFISLHTPLTSSFSSFWLVVWSASTPCCSAGREAQCDGTECLANTPCGVGACGGLEERDRPSNNCPLLTHTLTVMSHGFSTCTQRKSCILYALSFIPTFLSPLQSRSLFCLCSHFHGLDPGKLSLWVTYRAIVEVATAETLCLWIGKGRPVIHSNVNQKYWFIFT